MKELPGKRGISRNAQRGSRSRPPHRDRRFKKKTQGKNGTASKIGSSNIRTVKTSNGRTLLRQTVSEYFEKRQKADSRKRKRYYRGTDAAMAAPYLTDGFGKRRGKKQKSMEKGGQGRLHPAKRKNRRKFSARVLPLVGATSKTESSKVARMRQEKKRGLRAREGRKSMGPQEAGSFWQKKVSAKPGNVARKSDLKSRD